MLSRESESDGFILVRASMFTAPDDISRMTICPAYRSSLGIGSRRWSRRCSQRCHVPEYYRVMPMGNRARLTVKSKNILKRASKFIPISEYLKDHIFEMQRNPQEIYYR